MALAAISDVEAVSRPVPDGDQARVQRLIELVSASVVTYTGQSFELVEDDVVTVTPHDGVVRLPQRPVVSVASVFEFGNEVDPAQYTCSPNGYLRRAWPLYDLNPWDDDYIEPVGFPAGYQNRTLWFGSPLTVTYTHGYPDGTSPDDIALVVAEKVAEKWNTVPEATSVASKQVAGFTVAYRELATGKGWDPAHKLTLDAYRRSGLASLRLTT